MFLLLIEAIDHAVRLKNFLMIKVKPVCTLLMKNCLENQKSTNLKMIMHILIDQFFKFTTNFGFKLGLVDFKIVSIDSTPIKAYVNEFRSLSILGQIIYFGRFNL